MFKDTEKELKWLEEQLLEEEAPKEEPQPKAAPIPAYNADRADRDLSDLVQEEAPAPKEKLTGLVVTALLLTAGILALVAWWLVRLFG